MRFSILQPILCVCEHTKGFSLWMTEPINVSNAGPQGDERLYVCGRHVYA